MINFIGKLIDGNKNAKGAKIYFDFKSLNFIEPEGIVTLSNLIEYFRLRGLTIGFKNHEIPSKAIQFLDDSGFFQHYLKRTIFNNSKVRSTTIPLNIVHQQQYVSYLYTKLIPWIGMETGIQGESLDLLRAMLEEIIHNIEFHSDVKVGCFFAQHFPANRIISIAIADFGCGIPKNVKTIHPEISHQEALKIALKEGFTTKSNVRNRGAGLALLTNYVAQINDGALLIHSGQGYLSATRGQFSPNITSRALTGFYPGTMVQVLLRTDTIKRTEASLEKEDFAW